MIQAYDVNLKNKKEMLRNMQQQLTLYLAQYKHLVLAGTIYCGTLRYLLLPGKV